MAEPRRAHCDEIYSLTTPVIASIQPISVRKTLSGFLPLPYDKASATILPAVQAEELMTAHRGKGHTERRGSSLPSWALLAERMQLTPPEAKPSRPD